MSQPRCIATTAIAVLALACTAATASAQTHTDTTVGDFTAGTTAGTYVGQSDAGPTDGEVVLSPTVGEEFEGSALPAGWTGTPWEMGGTAQVTGGALVVNGARAGTTAAYPAGRSLEFVATFGNAPFQHAGFGTDFNDGPWAMFSTGGGALATGLYARTLTGPAATGTAVNTPIAATPTVPHRYRIVWTATGATYYVDGNEVATHVVAPTTDMRPLASDFSVAAPGVSVQWLRMSPYAATGTFTSRVFDAGDSRTLWRTLATNASTPPGTSITIQTRTGTGTSWSPWQAVGTGGAIASPAGQRYLQYRATLGTSNPATTPVLRAVTIAYTVDTSAPATTIGGVTVIGRTAQVTFSSEAGARFQCSLDAGPFVPCASPTEYTGLTRGTHTVRVRAIDRVGNVGQPAERTFTVAPSTSGDTRGPRIRPEPRTVIVSRSGRFTVVLTCPDRETRCRISLRLRHRGRTIASKRVTVRGGDLKSVTLRLKRSARAALARKGRLKVIAVTTARDADGNRATTRTRMKLRAAS